MGHVTLLGEIQSQVVTGVRGAHLAWKQRSLVIRGRPLITGIEDFLTWDDIHLEARVCSSEHGYPGLHCRGSCVQGPLVEAGWPRTTGSRTPPTELTPLEIQRVQFKARNPRPALPRQPRAGLHRVQDKQLRGRGLQ